MGYEIDFLAVGEKGSGDAICIRWGNLQGSREEQKVVIIDAGYASTGEKIIEHIKKHFNTAIVDLLISTHPDADHVGGLATVLNSVEVKEFWIHQPWNHNKDLASKFHDGRITDNSISERIKNNLEKAYEAVKIAEKMKIPMKEPFQGTTWDNATLTVVGPTLAYYDSLIPEFSRMPEVKGEDGFGMIKAGLDSLVEKAKELINNVAEWFKDENLDDKDTTSAQNNSSVILKLEIDGKTCLFTGDAGSTALDYAIPFIDTTSIKFIQIPHHGSKRNVGPDILNKLLGEIVPE